MKSIIIAFTISLLCTHSYAKELYATVKKLKGTITVDRKILNVGDKVVVGKTVVAGKGSFVDIELPNGAGTTRLVNGSLKIESIKPTGTVYNLIKGKIFSYFSHNDKNKETVVKTNRAAYGIRGTRIVAESSKGENFLCVCNGEVEIKNNVGSTAPLKSRHYVYLSGDENNISKKIKNVWFGFYHDSFFEEMGVL